ncbi:hypothetical protein PSY81_23870, partial [Shigella flexneri]|nr:hypothetical protein [Shigella flexneri]
ATPWAAFMEFQLFKEFQMLSLIMSVAFSEFGDSPLKMSWFRRTQIRQITIIQISFQLSFCFCLFK